MKDPISFELAKLLNKKGINIPSEKRYNKKGVFDYSKSWSVSAPTIAEVVMWLYEEKSVWIYSYPVQPFSDGEEDYPKTVWISICVLMNQVMFEKFVDADNGLAINHHKCPITAYEAAIEYVLNNLI